MTPQANAILTHLKSSSYITALEALGVYGVYRLAARILEIRNAGYIVKTYDEKDAKGKQYARYPLVAPAAYGPAGTPIYAEWQKENYATVSRSRIARNIPPRPAYVRSIPMALAA